MAEPLQKLRQQWGVSEAAGAAFVALATASPEIGTNTVSAVKGLNSESSPQLASPQLNVLKSWTALTVKPEALTSQAIPYLAVIALAALLTIPPAWRGLQPVDGFIMLGAYALYVAQAVMRYRQQEEAVRWRSSEVWRAMCGVLAEV